MELVLMNKKKTVNTCSS